MRMRWTICPRCLEWGHVPVGRARCLDCQMQDARVARIWARIRVEEA
jgi:hypothetical protein